ncbi:MAG: helix-turn-helix domain-containing protein [Nevskiales bacterium]
MIRKKLSNKKLRARDAKRDVWQEALDALRDIKAGRAGARYKLELTLAAAARSKTGLSQGEFASMLGVSKRTLQEWEQGRRNPSGAAKALIAIVTKHPDVVRELAA